MSEYLQRGLGLSPFHAGLVFAPLGCTFAVTSLATRRVAVGNGRALITTGIGLTPVAVWRSVRCPGADGRHAPIDAIAVLLGIVGVGNGIAVPSLFGPALSEVRRRVWAPGQA